MRKFTFVFVLVMLQIGNLLAQDLGGTRFITPLPNSNIVLGVATDYTVMVKNYGTADVPTGDTILVYLFFYNGGWVNPQFVGGTVLTAPFKNGDSMQVTVKFTIPTTFTPGLRALGFAYLWSSHVPATVKVWGANFNLVTSSSLSEATEINKLYYSNGNLHLEMNYNHNSDARLVITNLNGQQIYNNSISNKSNGNAPLTLSLGDLPKGMYIVNLLSSGFNVNKKFVVQ